MGTFRSAALPASARSRLAIAMGIDAGLAVVVAIVTDFAIAVAAVPACVLYSATAAGVGGMGRDREQPVDHPRVRPAWSGRRAAGVALGVSALSLLLIGSLPAARAMVTRPARPRHRRSRLVAKASTRRAHDRAGSTRQSSNSRELTH